jgi:diaminobutyrate-2-oxoglutarate transaminase
LDFPTTVKDNFTTKLLSTLPEGMRSDIRLHFCGPTGTNAVEAAIKLCKSATGRSEIVAFQGSFHGMTSGAMAISGEVALRDNLANLIPGVHFFPFAYCHRCPLDLIPSTCDTNCISYLENSLKGSHSGITRPAAVILELVQGEGGGVIAPIEFVRRLRQVTAMLDIPLIVDEVQTGCGRTGRWYAFEHYDIEPDVLVLSKMLSGLGLPVAILAYNQRLDKWPPGAHTGTFRGNQLAFAAGSAFISLMESEQLLSNVNERGQQAASRLDFLRSRCNGLISDVRCLGLMIGVELSDSDGRPYAEAASAVQRTALQNGLIVEIGGQGNNVIRMLPPLNIDYATMDNAMTVFETSVDTVVKSLLSRNGDQ